MFKNVFSLAIPYVGISLPVVILIVIVLAASPDTARSLYAQAPDEASGLILNPPTGVDVRGEAPAGVPREEEGDDIEVLTRGPIHEAFARHVTEEPQPGQTAPRKPPEPIDEIPPEVKPEGENIEWIPGYWWWDDVREDFVWISGVWRAVPPEQRWVPGHWVEDGDKYVWVTGFWRNADAARVEYLPEPPESLDYGPTTAAPGDDYFWIPGCWLYRDTSYVWRAGYWQPYYADWVWTPSHYVWTPAGCIFIPGYWDYPLMYRGMLTAPIYYRRPIYLQPSYYCTPSTFIPTSSLLVHMFVRPSYGYYYFGDYYAGYQRYGIYPWWRNDIRRGYYDHLFTYYQTTYGRRGVNFANRIRGWHNYYTRHGDLRPPHTFAQQREFARKYRDNQYVNNSIVAQPIAEAVRGSKKRFESLSLPRRQEYAQSLTRSRQLANLRSNIERVVENRSRRDTVGPQRGDFRDGVRRGDASAVREGTRRALKPPTEGRRVLDLSQFGFRGTRGAEERTREDQIRADRARERTRRDGRIEDAIRGRPLERERTDRSPLSPFGRSEAARDDAQGQRSETLKDIRERLRDRINQRSEDAPRNIPRQNDADRTRRIPDRSESPSRGDSWLDRLRNRSRQPDTPSRRAIPQTPLNTQPTNPERTHRNQIPQDLRTPSRTSPFGRPDSSADRLRSLFRGQNDDRRSSSRATVPGVDGTRRSNDWGQRFRGSPFEARGQSSSSASPFSGRTDSSRSFGGTSRRSFEDQRGSLRSPGGASNRFSRPATSPSSNWSRGNSSREPHRDESKSDRFRSRKDR